MLSGEKHKCQEMAVNGDGIGEGKSDHMLIGFSVSNFKSFYRSQSISLKAADISRHRDHLVQAGNQKILKTGIIFGANAGGKSNFVKAVDFSNLIITKGLEYVDLSKQYFRLKDGCADLPGVFEYRICVEEQEYVYGIAISYTKREILGEWLVRMEQDGSETYIFNRDMDDDGNRVTGTEVKFYNQEEKVRMDIYLEDFGENISEPLKRVTILSDIALRSNEKRGVFSEILKVYLWFARMIIVFPTSKYENLGEIAGDDATKRLFSLMMKRFDTGIQSVESQDEGEIDLDRIFERLPYDEAEDAKQDVLREAEKHPVMFRMDNKMYILKKDKRGSLISAKMLLNHGNEKDMFEYMDESDGTKRLFHLIPLFYENLGMSTILIDEIDRSLHTNLTRRFLELFYHLTENQRNQMIMTTHDSNLLDLELVRQDEIWFVERQKDQSSSVFSLNQFKDRMGKEIDKEYLLGRYGAIPIFGPMEDDEWLISTD